MKLVTFRHDVESPASLGVIYNDMVINLGLLGEVTGNPMPDRMQDLIEMGPQALPPIQGWLDGFEDDFPIGTTLPLAGLELLAPIPRPQKNVFCIGLNYTEHVAESAPMMDGDASLPETPVVFSKPPTSIIGPDAPIRHDASITAELDWEVELAVIIGQRTFRATPETALDHVFGYSVMIDVSARDNQRGTQWLMSKGQDSYAPFGPWIVTADEITDPHNLDLWLTLNGVEKQRSNTRHMLFDIKRLIADISAGITLEAGDIIATGTPEGVGAGRNPQEWMWPGDVVSAGIAGIGTITHPVIDVTPAGAKRKGSRP